MATINDLSASDRNLSSQQQKDIVAAKNAYQAAQAKGDTEGMNAAHAQAESIRSQASGGSYSGSVDGSGSYSIGNKSGSGSSGISNMSSSDQSAIDRYRQQYNDAKASGNTALMEQAHSAAENIRKKYGYTGGDTGDQLQKIATTSQPAMSAEDTAKIKEWQDKYLAAQASGNVAAMNEAHAEAEKIRANYGFSGGDTGDQNIAIADNPYVIGTYKDQKLYDMLLNGQLSEVRSDQTSDGSKWVIEGNDIVVYKKDGTRMIAQRAATASDATEGIAKDTEGHLYNIIKLNDGSIVDIKDESGNDLAPGSIRLGVDGGRQADYIIHKGEYGTQLIKRAGGTVKLLDINTLEDVSFKDRNGNLISSSTLWRGDDGRIYSSADGRLMTDIAGDVSDSANYVVNVDGVYWDFNNNNVTDKINPLIKKDEWLIDKQTSLDQLMSEMFDRGYMGTPTRDMYNDRELTWDQALAQASNQLGQKYDASLNGMLDNMNQQALKTGFYGQLPTEALKQQAAASAEVDKQSAIFDLATDLMNNSRDYAQQMYEDDVDANSKRLDTLSTLIDTLYGAYEAQIKEANSQSEADRINNDFKAQLVNYAVQAMKNGIPADTLSQYIGKIS